MEMIHVKNDTALCFTTGCRKKEYADNPAKKITTSLIFRVYIYTRTFYPERP